MTKPSEQSENTYSLLVWETIPDNTTFYLIPNSVANHYRHYLEQAHNKLINNDDENDGMRFLNEALLDPQSSLLDEGNPIGDMCVFAQYKQSKDAPITNTHITHVYLSGFVL